MVLKLVKYVKPGSYLTIEEVAVLSGLHPDLIRRFVQLGLIDPVERDVLDQTWLFEEATVAIAKKIVRLRNELGINYAGIGVVLELLERLDSIEKRLRILEDKVATLRNSKDM